MKSILENFVLVNLGDIIVYSKNVVDHFGHLRQFFIKCREFNVSLNVGKCVFDTKKEKLLGHIVLGDGMTIDLERVKAILSLPLPNHKKGL